MPPNREAVTARYVKSAVDIRNAMTACHLWLRGNTIAGIAEALTMQDTAVLDAIRDMRAEIKLQHDVDIRELVAERIEAFRLIQREAWTLFDTKSRQSPQYLALIIKAEENIAKIQGVLTDKVQHLHRIVPPKLYDFDGSRFPEAIDAEVVDVTEVPGDAVVAIADPADSGEEIVDVMV